MAAPKIPGIIIKNLDNTNRPTYALKAEVIENFMAKANVSGTKAKIEFSFDVPDVILHNPPNNPGITDDDWDKNDGTLLFWAYRDLRNEILAMTNDKKLLHLDCIDKNQNPMKKDQKVIFDFIVDDGKIGGAG